MEERFTLSFILICCICLTACASSPVFRVQTEPEEATVFVLDSQSGDKKKIGATPLEKEEDTLKKELGTLGNGGQFVEVLVEKQGYETKQLWLPLSPSGILRSQLKVTLKPVEASESRETKINTVKSILNQMFLAQKFARLKQFERALIEIDKVLDTYPEFARGLTLKASIYFAQGDFNSSLKWYDKAIEVEPDFDHAIEMSAKVRQQLKLPPRQPASSRGGP